MQVYIISIINIMAQILNSQAVIYRLHIFMEISWSLIAYIYLYNYDLDLELILKSCVRNYVKGLDLVQKFSS